MTSLALMLVAPAVLGVDFGWQSVARDGAPGIEFMIRLTPEELEDLKNGEDVLSDLPPGMEMVHTYRITTIPDPLPHEGEPPRKRQTTLSSTGQPLLDPVTGQAIPHGYGIPAGYVPAGTQPGFNNLSSSSANPYAPSNLGNASWTNNTAGGLNSSWNTTTANNTPYTTRPAAGAAPGSVYYGTQNSSGSYSGQSYGEYLPAQPNIYSTPAHQLAQNVAPSSYIPPTAPYANQPGVYPNSYANPYLANNPSNPAFRPNGNASLAGVTPTKQVSTTGWITTLIALGLSLGANAYLGMLSAGLYQRCRVLLGQLRFASLR